MMETATARVSAKYQLVIPKAVREKLGLKPQDAVLFLIDGETVIMRPVPKSFVEALRGLHRDLWPDPDAWLEEERSTWE
jgi:AbrB family looped-hinge helix DNA binding protein